MLKREKPPGETPRGFPSKAFIGTQLNCLCCLVTAAAVGSSKLSVLGLLLDFAKLRWLLCVI